jgi:hypothetical protein
MPTPPSHETGPFDGDSVGSAGSPGGSSSGPDHGTVMSGTGQPSVSNTSQEAQSTQWPPSQEEPASAHGMRITYRGVLLSVTAKRNARGAWIPEIAALFEGRPMDLPNVQPVTPEWLTEDEALRAGIEHGRYLVDRSLPNPAQQE